MSIFKKLFGKKTEAKKEKIDLSMLENHFVLNVGELHCDRCKKETLNCVKLDIADQHVCVCPRKDIKSFRRPFREDKEQ